MFPARWGGGNLEQSIPNPWLGLSQTGDGGCRAWEFGHTCSQAPIPNSQPSAAQGLGAWEPDTALGQLGP